jgi:hypothetical protein
MKKSIQTLISLNSVLALVFGCLPHDAFAAGYGTGEMTPSVKFVGVDGDSEKFREDHWLKDGLTGGVEDYNYILEDEKGDFVVTEGKGIAGDDDYRLDLDVKKEGMGEFILEFKQFKKYYDGTGGFYAGHAPTAATPDLKYEIDRDLSLNIGDIKAEAIFSEVEETKCAVSYQREYRKGAKSLTSWSSVTDGVTSKLILPTFMECYEIVDKFDMELEHKMGDIDVTFEQEVELVESSIQKVNNRTYTTTTGLFTNIRRKYEDLDAKIYNSILRVSRELNEKILLSTSFMYNHFTGHTMETVKDTSVAATNENNPDNPAYIKQDSFTILPRADIQLMDDLLMGTGVKWDFSNKRGVGTYNRDTTNPPDGELEEILDITDRVLENKLWEFVEFKYDGLDNIVFYSEGGFGQELRYENNTQWSHGKTGAGGSATNDFFRATNAVTSDYEYTVGTKCYPLSKVDITAEFERKSGNRDYNAGKRAELFGDPASPRGYSAFLDSLRCDSYKPMAMLNVKPFDPITCTLRYTYDSRRYGVQAADVPAIERTENNTHIISGGTTITPVADLYMSLFYQYRDALTHLPRSDIDGVGKLPEYNANSHSVITSCSYSPVKGTTISGSYSFALANNYNDYWTSGLPLGLDNLLQNAAISLERELTDNMSLVVGYEMAQYAEDSSMGYDDYSAHIGYTSLKVKF